jgi:hypothetical protein
VIETNNSTQTGTGHFAALFDFTHLEIKEARRQVRSGHRDAAYSTWRFITNSQIIPILQGQEFFGREGVALMKWELAELQRECVPGAHLKPDDDSKLIAIRLEILAGGINTLISLHQGGVK